jgi:DNA-binding NarL/FixJ family response regulator
VNLEPRSGFGVGQSIRNTRGSAGQASASEHPERLDWRSHGLLASARSHRLARMTGRTEADCRALLGVMLVDDHAIERQGLCALIEARPDMKVIAEAGDAREALRLMASANPDVVITETLMPHMTGAELTSRLRRSHPGIRVIALTRNDEPERVLEMVQAGVAAYLVKSATLDDLVAAVRSVSNGRCVLGTHALSAVLRDYVQRCRDSRRPSSVSLTARQREVLMLIAEGYSNRSIGEQLGLCPGTIYAHRRNIMRKLDMHTVADLVKHAIRVGLGSLE